MLKRIQKYIKNESGATAIEYGLIAALVGVAILGAVSTTGSNVNALHNQVSERVTTAIKNAGK